MSSYLFSFGKWRSLNKLLEFEREASLKKCLSGKQIQYKKVEASIPELFIFIVNQLTFRGIQLYARILFSCSQKMWRPLLQFLIFQLLEEWISNS